MKTVHSFSFFISFLILSLGNGQEQNEDPHDDLLLTYNQKVALDKVLDFSKNQISMHVRFSWHFSFQFTERVAHKLPHDYMKEPVYLVRWLRGKYKL